MTVGVRKRQRPEGSQLRYVMIRKAIEAAIVENRLPAGFVIAEGEVADLFGTSRNPVRKALQQLVESNFLLPRAVDHGPVVRGVGENSFKRAPITRNMLGLQNDAVLEAKSSAQRVFDDMECIISTAFLFGSYHILEQEAADFYSVSRMTIREVLNKLLDRGLVDKVPYGAWIARALTPERVGQEYELRQLLEPAALEAVTAIGVPGVEKMLARVERVIASPGLYVSEVEEIERDLHHTCLLAYPNTRLRSVVRDNKASQMIGQVFFRALPLLPDIAAMEEHQEILKALYDRKSSVVGQLAREHLSNACVRNRRRLRTLSSMTTSDLPPYLDLAPQSD